MKKSNIGMWAGISGGMSVIILALASHFLPKYLEINIVTSITTGAQIQLFHAILGITLSTEYFNSKNVVLGSKLILGGSILFSGSIYILGLNSLIGISFLKIFGPITPLGGLMMILGWFLLAFKFSSKKLLE